MSTDIEKLANKVYNDMLQEETHLSVITDVLIGRIEASLKHYDNLVRIMGKNNPQLKELNQRVDTLKRHLALCKIYTGAIKSFVKKTFSAEDHYQSILSLSKQFDRMFSMDEDKISLVQIAISMIEKGKFPTYIDLSTSKMQEVSKRSGLPLEYVRQVLAHIPDVLINETE